MSSLDAPHQITFPPLMSGEAVAPGAVFQTAVMRAAAGCDAGLVVYALAEAEISGAIVFAPEVPLRQAVAMLPLCGVGFQNALGALAPPELAVHLDWDGGLRINGASCGRLHLFAETTDADAVPDWLIVGFELPLLPATDDVGNQPDRTYLFMEGCAEVEPPHLMEAWARHTLNWINRWEEPAGARALAVDWRGMAHGVGEELTRDDTSGVARTGTFLGVDEDFGMLLRDADGTHLIPLTTLIEDTP